MRLTKLFTKTTKENPKDEVSKNAQLLHRAGYIYKEMAGVYCYLPLGLQVIENIKNIVREEMNAIGGQEMIMTSLQRKELWEVTDRWSDENVDVWFKSALKNGTEIGFGWSHEEPIIEMLKQYVHSYKDLPIFTYQFQTKLRNELRAKSGIMRGREFVMKDLYSFCTDAKEHDAFYNRVIDAYFRVFERVGLKADTFITFASGGAFTEFSHEFQTITDAGEDEIYINREKNIAINAEVYNEETLKKLGVTAEELTKVTTAEVGNIFNFGTHKCEQLDMRFTDESGKSVPVYLGSYGIGITRLMGVMVEHFSDELGLVWPEAVAPYQVQLISLCREDADIAQSDSIYETLRTAGITVLYDDRIGVQAGEKFSDADLLGMPMQVIVSAKTLADEQVEVRPRTDKNAAMRMSVEELITRLKKA